MARRIDLIISTLLTEAESESRCAFSENRSVRRALFRRFERGELLMPIRNLFARPSYWKDLLPHEQGMHMLRSVQRIHPDWVFSHYSAALIYGLYVSKPLCSTVHVSSTYQDCRNGVMHHIDRQQEYTEYSGFRVTSLRQTLFDCMRTAGFGNALAIADSGVALMHTLGEELPTSCNAWRGCKGVQKVRSALSFANPKSENGGESIARASMIEHGFQIPELQVEIPDPLIPGNQYRVDFFWDLGTRKVAGELDGLVKYTDARCMGGRSIEQVLMDERERESHLNALGLQIMRFKFKQVLDDKYFVHLLERFGIPRLVERRPLPF